MARVAAAGDNSTDVYIELGQTFPGGNAVNVAVYLVRLGEQASYTGFIGTDDYGKAMRTALTTKGVDVYHLHTKEGTSPFTLITLENGNRVFGEYDEGVMEHFELSEEDIDFLCEHDLIHTSVWSRIEKYLPQLKQRGKTISFDFSDQPEHEVVGQALPYVDYAFFSFEEDSPELREYIRNAWEKGPKYVIATLGENGSIAYDGEVFLEQGIVPVKVVDTMGAGDSFIAGFIQAILQGKSLKECLTAGAESSAVTLQYTGAWLV
jgi:fructoselysine 6-kinase